MRKNLRFVLHCIIATCIVLACGGCYTTCRCTATQPALENLKSWKSYLQVTEAPANAPIGTTQTHISNVGHSMAAAKMLLAMEAYDDDLGYRLSTVFTLAERDTSEGEEAGPAVTAMVIEGHLYYIGFLDWSKDKSNRAAYEQTKGIIPAVAVVDGEDETKPAWIRTKDAKGKPYAIELYMGTQAVVDDDNIYRFLRSKGYTTISGCYRLDNPILEFDDDWRPYFTATYTYDDGCAEIGDMYYPVKLLVADAQTRELKEYALDNPNTHDVDERAKDIPEWIDQVYSPRMVREWIEMWGLNLDNYGKTSDINNFVVDDGHIDQVMNDKNTNLVFVSYLTSVHPDNACIGVMLVDPRTGKGTFYRTQGTEHAMAVKSAAVNAIRQATHRWDYDVEDLTLHTIFGVPTWQGELIRPAFKHAGTNREEPGTEKPAEDADKPKDQAYGTLYAGTVLLRADYDVKPAGVIWAFSKHEALTRYEKYLYLSQTQRVGSNVLIDKDITAKVGSILPFVDNGSTSYLVVLVDHPHELYEVDIAYVGDPNTEDVLSAQPGDEVEIRYGDPMNRKTFLVREFHLKPGQAPQPGPLP